MGINLFLKLAKALKNTKLAQIFNSGVKVRLNCLQSTGDPVLLKKEQVFGKGQKLLATIEHYTEPCNIINSNGTKAASIHRRIYTPAANSPLAKMGIESVTRTSSPLAHGISAVAKRADGKPLDLGPVAEVRNYVRLMK